MNVRSKVANKEIGKSRLLMDIQGEIHTLKMVVLTANGHKKWNENYLLNGVYPTFHKL